MPVGIEAPKNRRDGGSDFTLLVEYVRDAEKTQGSVWTLNCLSIETAGFEMEGTATQAPRCESYAYHSIISFPVDEKPTEEQAREAGMIALKRLGFDAEDGGHQAVIAFHKDTDDFHIHLGVNTVHPQTGIAHNIRMSHTALHIACREIEIEQGWSEQKGLVETITDVDGNTKIISSEYRNENNKGINKKALDMEKHAGVYSFQRYIKETVAPALKEEIKKSPNWESVHQFLNKYNVKIIESGAGFAFEDQPLFKKDFTEEEKSKEVERASQIHASATEAGVSFAKHAKLTLKLGEYQKSKNERALPELRYNPEGIEGAEQVLNYKEAKEGISQEEKDEKRIRAIFDGQNKKRRNVFAYKKEKRTKDITDVNKIEEKKLQEFLNKSRKATHASNAKLSPELKRPTADVNAVLRLERENKKAELEEKKDQRQKAFNEEFEALEKKLQKHNSYHRWLYEESQKEGEMADLALHFYNKSKYRNQVLKEEELKDLKEKGENIIEAPANKKHTIIAVFVVSETIKNQGGYHVFTNKNNITYTKNRDVKFRDYGDTVTIKNEEEAIRDGLKLSQEKWGNVIKLKGSEAFQAKAARIAYEIGLKDIQTDDVQAKEIFNSLKENRTTVDVAKEQEKAIQNQSKNSSSVNVNKGKYMDFTSSEVRGELNKKVNLLKIAESYGYKVKEDAGSAIRLTKDEKVLDINLKAGGDIFLLTDNGIETSGSAVDFVRHEDKLDFEKSAEKLFLLSRRFPKSQNDLRKEYDLEYVRYQYASATNNAEDMKVLNDKGIFKNDLGSNVRVNEIGEVFFPHFNVSGSIVGFEVKTQEERPAWFVKGGQKGLYLANDIDSKDVQRVVVTMDAMEAEALKKLEKQEDPSLIKKTLYTSATTTMGKRQLEILKQYQHAQIELRVGQNNSKTIEKTIATLQKTFKNLNTIKSSEKSTDRLAKSHFSQGREQDRSSSLER